jgi:hypothetical protein
LRRGEDERGGEGEGDVRLASINGPSEIIRDERNSSLLTIDQDQHRRDDAEHRDEISYEIALAAVEISQRGPEQRRDDADGWHARGVVVELRYAVAAFALQPERDERVGGETLRLACDHPESDEAVPLPGAEYLEQEL